MKKMMLILVLLLSSCQKNEIQKEVLRLSDVFQKSDVFMVNDEVLSASESELLYDWMEGVSLQLCEENEQCRNVSDKVGEDAVHISQAGVDLLMNPFDEFVVVSGLENEVYFVLDDGFKEFFEKEEVIEEEIVEKEVSMVYYEPPFENPSLSSVSKQYQEQNLAYLQQDLLFVKDNVWGDLFLSDDVEKRNLQTLLYAFETDVQSNSKLGSVFNLLTPLSVEASREKTGYEPTRYFIIDGEEIVLEGEGVSEYSRFYRGEDVRKMFENVYGMTAPEGDNHIQWFYYDIYDETNDLYICFQYRDGAIAGYPRNTAYLINQERNGNELILDVAFIPIRYYFSQDSEKVIAYKNSGLPILPRHLNGKELKISELIQEQPQHVDRYQVKASVNDDGSYRLMSYQNMTPIFMNENDVIFYNNYEKNNGKKIFLPLFDCSLCFEYNQFILERYVYDHQYHGEFRFYEDEKIAVVFYLDDEDNDYWTAFVVDKVNRCIPILDEKSSEVYRKLLKDEVQDVDSLIFTYFEIDGKKLLQISRDYFRFPLRLVELKS